MDRVREAAFTASMFVMVHFRLTSSPDARREPRLKRLSVRVYALHHLTELAPLILLRVRLRNARREPPGVSQ